MQVIVNVDDVGLHPAVQRAVEAGAAAGIVTSASVLANGPCVHDARRLRGIGLGAHLNILRGKPLSPSEDVSTLIGQRDLFLGSYPRLFLRYLSHQLDLGQVEREWDRQIEFLLSMGLALTHVDSEKHIHCWPRLMPIACRLARRHGLRWVRRTVEPSPLTRWDAGGLRAKLLCAWGWFHRLPPECRDLKTASLSRRLQSCAAPMAGSDNACWPSGNDDQTVRADGTDSVSWPDAVWGVADQGHRLQAARFGSYVSRLGHARVVEIACHPGVPGLGDDPIPASFGTLRVQDLWGPEYRSLMQGHWQDVFEEHGLALAHYGQSE